jgi:hypothetical protein
MFVTGIEQMLMGVMALQTLTALVGSMSKPKREDGFYAYWYRFFHVWTNMIDAYFEKKYDMPMPRVVDESLNQRIATPDSVTEIAVTKTTQNP